MPKLTIPTFTGTVMLNIGSLPSWVNDKEIEVVTIWVADGDYKDEILSFPINRFLSLFATNGGFKLALASDGDCDDVIFLMNSHPLIPVLKEYVKVMENIDAHQTPITFNIENGEITGMIGAN